MTVKRVVIDCDDQTALVVTVDVEHAGGAVRQYRRRFATVAAPAATRGVADPLALAFGELILGRFIEWPRVQ